MDDEEFEEECECGEVHDEEVYFEADSPLPLPHFLAFAACKYMSGIAHETGVLFQTLASTFAVRGFMESRNIAAKELEAQVTFLAKD